MHYFSLSIANLIYMHTFPQQWTQ